MTKWNPFRRNKANKNCRGRKSPFPRPRFPLDLERFESRWYPGEMLTALALSALGNVAFFFREQLLALFDGHSDAATRVPLILRPAESLLPGAEGPAPDPSRISLLPVVLGAVDGAAGDGRGEPRSSAGVGNGRTAIPPDAFGRFEWDDAGNLFEDLFSDGTKRPLARLTASDTTEQPNVGGDGSAGVGPGGSSSSDGPPVPLRPDRELPGFGMADQPTLAEVVGSSHRPPPDGSGGGGVADENPTPPRELPPVPHLQRTYGQVPLNFEPNQGQSDSRVRFLSRGRGYNLFFTSTEAVLILHKPLPEPRGRAVLRLQMIGANPGAQATGEDRLPGISNFLLGNDPTRWRTNIQNYRRVRFASVYPGVDLVYYGTHQRQLEFDFVVAPGANPGVIQLAFQGAASARLDQNGHLVLSTPGGDVVQRSPLVYQLNNGRRQRVAGRHVLDGAGRVGFQIGAYDTNRPLYIDPVLSYSSYLGGSGTDIGFGIAVDSIGSSYVTGYTDSANFPTSNPLDPDLNGGRDVFVTKVDSAGTALIYSTYLGGGSNDEGRAITVDALGNVYLTGLTHSTGFPVVNALQSALRGSRDAFVTKLAAAGNSLLYSTYLGGNESSTEDEGVAIAVDAAYRAYVTGTTSASDFHTTAGVIRPTFQGGVRDAFVTKLDPALPGQPSLIYSTYLGGNDRDYGLSIALDASNNAYVTGHTRSTNFPIANALQSTLGDLVDGDAYLTKLNTGATAALYSTYLGGNADDRGLGVGVDGSGKAYITGATKSNSFVTTASAYQTSNGGGWDAYLTKIDPALAGGSSLLYSTYLGGSSDENFPCSSDYCFAGGIAISWEGAVYLTGTTLSTNYPTAAAFQPSHAGSYDAFVARLDPTQSGSASVIYSTYLGGSASDIGYGIALLPLADIVYVTGSTSSADFPVFTPVQSMGGLIDIFISRIGARPVQRRNNPDSTWLGLGLDEAAPNTGTLRITHPLDFYRTQESSLDSFFGLGTEPALVYNSDTVHVRPAGEITPRYSVPSGRPNSFTLNFHWNPSPPYPPPDTTYFSENLAALPGATYLLQAQVKAADTVTRTDLYPWLYNVVAFFPGPPPRTVDWSFYDVAHAVVTDDTITTSLDNSPFGPGWSLAGVNRLVAAGGGYLMVFGSGDASRYYVANVAGGFNSPADDLGTLDWTPGGGTSALTYTSREKVKWNYQELETGKLLLTSIVDPHNLAVTFTYGGRLLQTIQMPDGGLTTFTYSAPPYRLQRIDEPGGRYLTFTHDPDLRLTNIRSDDGGLRTFSYGQQAYDTRRIVNDRWGPQNVIYSYDSDNNNTGVLEGIDRGANTTMTLSPANVQSLGGPSLPGAPVVKIGDAVGTLKNALGNTTTHTLDGLGRQTKLQRPGEDPAQAQTWSRDHAGQVIRYKDGRNYPTTYTYDYTNRRGDLVRAQYPDTGVEEFKYHADFPKVTEYKDTRGNRTTTTYLGTQDVWKVQDALNNVTTYTWDNGLLQSVEDPRRNITTYQYYTAAPNQRRLQVQTNPDLGLTRYLEYDGAGNPTRVEDPRQQVTTMLYDASRRLLGQTDARQGKLTMTYSATGQLTTRTDQEGRTVTYTYDGRDLPLETIEPVQGAETRITTTIYDNVPRLLFVKDPRNVITSYGYDDRDRRNLIIEAVGYDIQRQTTMLYDNADNLLSVTTGISSLGTYVHLQRTSYAYDPLNRRTTMIEAFGTGLVRITNTEYDTEGNVKTVTDPRAVITSYSYDQLNRLSRTDQAHNTGDQRSTTVLYDQAGNVLSVTTGIAPLATYAHRVTTIYDYDAMNRRTLVIEDPGGSGLNRATHSQYDKNGNVTTMVNARGVTSTHLYDELNRRIAMTEAAILPPNVPLSHPAPLTCYMYDRVGNLIALKNPRDVITSYTYDKLNRRTEVREAAIYTLPLLPHASPITTTVYDKVGNVIAVQNPRGVVTSYLYDALNRRIAVIEAAIVPPPPFPQLPHGSPTTIFTYDAADNVLAVQDPRGVLTTHLYDTLNRRVDTTEAANSQADKRRTTMLYDANNNLIEMTNPRGVRSSYGYDALNRRVVVHEAWYAPPSLPTMNHGGPVTTTVYDAADNVLAVVDPRGMRTSYTYDNLNRRLTTLDPREGLIRQFYDLMNNVTLVIDAAPLNNRTTMVYDALDRKVAEGHPYTTPPIVTATYEYNAGGLLISTADRAGRIRNMSYDALNRFVTEAWPSSGNLLTHTYDIANNRLTAASKIGPGAQDIGTYVFTYDALNRKVSQQGPYETWLTHTYDIASNRIRVDDRVRADAQSFFSGVTTSTYDALNRLQSRGFSGVSVTQLRVDIKYSPTSQPVTITRFRDLAGSNRVGDPSTLSYDALERAANIQHKSGVWSSNTTYTYDIASRLLVENRSTAPGPVTYQYDDANQLTYDSLRTYAYDLNGNRTSMTEYPATVMNYGDAQAGNRLTTAAYWPGSVAPPNRSYPWVTHQYDLNGNLTGKCRYTAYDPEPYRYGVVYSYDERNQMTYAGIRPFELGNCDVYQVEPMPVRATYVYDVFGLRVQKHVIQPPSYPVPGDVTRFAYDGQTLWADLNGNPGGNNALLVRYLHGDGVDQLFARVAADGTAKWYMTDRLGSVRDLVNHATGNVDPTDSISYDGFGWREPTGYFTSVYDRMAFTGREWDGETALQYHRARYYDPETGRWTSEDPIGFDAGDPNLYRYVRNGPTNATDRAGLAQLTEKEIRQLLGIWDHEVAKYVKNLIFRGRDPRFYQSSFYIGKESGHVFVFDVNKSAGAAAQYLIDQVRKGPFKRHFEEETGLVPRPPAEIRPHPSSAEGFAADMRAAQEYRQRMRDQGYSEIYIQLERVLRPGADAGGGLTVFDALPGGKAGARTSRASPMRGPGGSRGRGHASPVGLPHQPSGTASRGAASTSAPSLSELGKRGVFDIGQVARRGQWRAELRALELNKEGMGMVYVIYDMRTGEMLKVGSSRAPNALDRFSSGASGYLQRAESQNREIGAVIFPVEGNRASVLEDYLRNNMRAGPLPWEGPRTQGVPR